MRALILLLIISAATTGFAASQRTVNSSPAIDPLVTGKRITKQQKALWLEQKAQTITCPHCAVAQPFPGDE